MAFWRKKKVAVPASEDPTALGTILIAEGLLSPVDLMKALSRLRDKAGSKLGEVLVIMGLLSQEQVDLALTKQQLERNEISPEEAIAKTMSVQSALQLKATKEIKEVTDKFQSLKRS